MQYWIGVRAGVRLACSFAPQQKNITMKRVIYFLGAVLAGSLLFASCHEAENHEGDGGTGGDGGSGSGADSAMVVREMKALDVSEYDQWVYVVFEDGTFQAKGVKDVPPEKWDIALHRENVKTNGGMALKTEVTSFEALTGIPEGSVFRADELTYTEVAVDMSRMMQGIIVYDTTEINMAMEDWVKRSGMPPVYSVQPNVYVVKTKDGQYAKIQFTSYKGGENGDEDGYATFTYGFPFLSGSTE